MRVKVSDILRFIAALSIVALGVMAGSWIGGNAHAAELVRSFGYLGVLIISVISGFNLAVPVPAAAFMPSFLAAGLSFWPVVLFMSLGMLLADATAFFIGSSGRKLVKDEGRVHRVLERLRALRRRASVTPYLVLALWVVIVPLPNEVLLVPMGLLGYRLRTLVPILLIGNIVFNVLFAKGVLGFLGG